LMDIETGEVTILVEGRGQLSYPTLAPDGEILIYASNEAGSDDYYATDLRNLGFSTNLSAGFTSDHVSSMVHWAPTRTERIE